MQELIKALTYFDISNRRDKNNPNRRWGYEEVRNWLAGKEQTIPGEGVDRKTIRPYFFAGENYTTRTELARGLASHWEEGTKELFRGKLSDYYSLYDPEACRICQEAEQEASHVSGQDDLIFWKTLYALMPECTDFFWKGRVYAGLPALGRELLEHLRQNTGARTEFMAQILTAGILSHYVKLKNPDDRKMLEAVQSLENSYCAPRNDTRQKMIVLYLTAYMLSGQKILYVANREFHDLQELSAYMRQLLGENNEHLDRFKKFCHTLVDRYDNLIPALESWLIAIGKRDALNSWKNAMDSL